VVLIRGASLALYAPPGGAVDAYRREGRLPFFKTDRFAENSTLLSMLGYANHLPL